MTVTAASFSALSGMRHAFFTRDGGVSSGIYTSLNGGIASKDDAAHVVENRARMARALGVTPGHLVTTYQIHSPDVVVAEKPWQASSRPKADAVVTRVSGLAIGVTTADCGPVLFADEKARVIGAAHAGWRGSLSGVLEAALGAMEKLGAKRADIVTALGPMIRQPNYEVGAEFFATFVKASGDNDRFFKKAEHADHFMFDLPGYIAARLTQAGVRAIEDCGYCTYAEPERFYSYRRSQHRKEPDYGRHVNGIVLSH